MNKKLLAAIGISGTLMLGSVYSISANTSGYDLYKEALKKTHSADSATLHFNLTLEDNKKSILSSESIFKSDSVNQVNSISTRLANESEVSMMNMYKQDGNWFVMKDGLDTVYKMDTSNNPHHSNTAELKDDVENLIDVMTKNLQQQITVDEMKNGNHDIELDLTGKEISIYISYAELIGFRDVLLEDHRTIGQFVQPVHVFFREARSREESSISLHTSAECTMQLYHHIAFTGSKEIPDRISIIGKNSLWDL